MSGAAHQGQPLLSTLCDLSPRSQHTQHPSLSFHACEVMAPWVPTVGLGGDKGRAKNMRVSVTGLTSPGALAGRHCTLAQPGRAQFPCLPVAALAARLACHDF